MIQPFDGKVSHSFVCSDESDEQLIYQVQYDLDVQPKIFLPNLPFQDMLLVNL